MVLRNQVEWALHCCSVLSTLPPGEYLSTKALAEFHGVPKEYLSKGLQGLAEAKVIEGTLGPKGGYRLAREPHQISFLDIVEAVEGKSHSFRCTEIRGNNPCLGKAERKFDSVCAVAQVMYQADEAWRAKLRSVTLRDLGKAVAASMPAEILERSGEWLRSR